MVEEKFYELPHGWKWVRLEDIILRVQYGLSKAMNVGGIGYPIVRMNNITYDGRLDLTDLKYITIDDKIASKYILNKGDILFNRTNSKELVGKTAVFNRDGKFVFASYLIRAIIDPSKALPEYICAFLNSKRGKEILFDMARPAVQMANINAKELCSIHIPLAHLEEQKRIIARIEELVSRVDEAKRLRKFARKETERIMQAALYKVFSKAEEEGWDWARLKDVGKYINGRAFKPEEWEREGLPIIRIQNLTNPDTPFNYYSKPVEQKYYVRDGELLISWSASLDAFIWMRGNAILNQHIFRVEINKKLIHKEFLFYMIKYILWQIQEKTHGTTMKHITKGKFENLKIPLPSLEEQKKMVAYLDRIRENERSLKKFQQKTEEELEKLVPAVLDRAFKGKL